jgi:hypothetical protein
MRGPSLLYIGDQDPGTTARDRAEALAGLGAEVTHLASPRLGGLAARIDWQLRSRLQVGPVISRTNAAIEQVVSHRSFDLAWIDKGWMIRPSTMRAIRRSCRAVVLFNNDNPWGEHERGLWRLHLAVVPLVDEVITSKYSAVRPYELAGASRVSVVDFGFAPKRHFAAANPQGDFQHDVCFIGTALRDGGGIRPHRTDLLIELAKAIPGRVSLFGHGWSRIVRRCAELFRVVGEGAWNDEYRKTIWASRINLSFITKDNWEEMSHRAFEITACGGCLIAERASRLEQSFKEDREALYFSTSDELVMAVRRLLADETLRARIAEAGTQRAHRSGYDNASRLAEAISRSPILRPFFPIPEPSTERSIERATEQTGQTTSNRAGTAG